jgi:hypothetical protein
MSGIRFYCMFNGGMLVAARGNRCPLCDVAADDPGFLDCHDIDIDITPEEAAAAAAEVEADWQVARQALEDMDFFDFDYNAETNP